MTTLGRLASQYTQGAVASDRRGRPRGGPPSLVRGGRAGRAGVVARVPDVGGTARAGRERAVTGSASITKTFTAVLVLRLRDEASSTSVTLWRSHLPGTGAGRPPSPNSSRTTGGLAAESPGLVGADTGLPASGAPRCAGEQPLLHRSPPHHFRTPATRCWRTRGGAARCPWEERTPAGSTRALGPRPHESQPQAPHAGGWAVHPWADALLPEPVEDLGRMAAAGQLCPPSETWLGSPVFLATGTIVF